MLLEIANIALWFIAVSPLELTRKRMRDAERWWSVGKSEEDLKAQYAKEYQFYYDKGNALYQLGKCEEAIACFREATTLNPACAWAFGNLAVVLAELDRYNEALQAIEKAIQIDPDDDDFRQNKAEILKCLQRVASTEKSPQDLNSELFAALSILDARRAIELVERGADVEAVDAEGNTPLHYFYQCPSIQTCKDLAQTLVAHGADVNAKNRVGDTPIVKLQGITREQHKKELTPFLEALGATLDAKAVQVKCERISAMRNSLAADVRNISLDNQDNEHIAPGASRDHKQVALLVGILSVMCLVFGAFLIVAGVVTFAKAWGVLLGLTVVAVIAGIYVFAVPSRLDPVEVEQISDYIARVRKRGADEGWESHKGKLRFFLPPDWRRQKIGKEGWLIYPKGLGAPLIFSVWAFTGDPDFPGKTLEEKVRSAQDLGHRCGYKLVRDTVCECEVAGQEAIQYTLEARGRQRVLGYLWKYEGDDYQFLVEASSLGHIHAVRPAVDEFLQGMFMW